MLQFGDIRLCQAEATVFSRRSHRFYCLGPLAAEMRNFVHRYHPAIKRVHGLNLNCLDANKFTYSDLPP
jgi:hypothetical protein